MNDIEKNDPKLRPNQKILPAIDLLLPSINIIRANTLIFFVLSVVPTLLIHIGTNPRATSSTDLYSPEAFLGSLLAVVFYAPLIYAMTTLSAGKTVTLSRALSEGFGYFVKLVALGIISAFIIIIGFILFIIPGIIAIRKLLLAPYILISTNVSPVEAIRQSSRLSGKNTGAIYGVVGISILFSLSGRLLQPINGMPVGAIISTILAFLYSVAPAIRYVQMRNVYGSDK